MASIGSKDKKDTHRKLTAILCPDSRVRSAYRKTPQLKP